MHSLKGSNMHEDVRTCAADDNAGDDQTVQETVRERGQLASVAVQEGVQEVCKEVGKVGSLPLANATPGSSPALGPTVAQTVAQTVATELVRRATAELAEDAGRSYAIRGRPLSDGTAQIAIPARSGDRETETALLQVRCGEAALRSAFDRIGGPSRGRFERSADQLTGLLGRAPALAYAMVEIVGDESISADTSKVSIRQSVRTA